MLSRFFGLAMGRLAMLGWVAGAAFTHTRSVLPGIAAQAVIATTLVCLGLLVACLNKSFARARCVRGAWHLPLPALCCALVVSGFTLLGDAYAVWSARERLANELDRSLQDKVTRLTFQVVGLSADHDGSRRFEAQVLDKVPAGVPRRIMVNWSSPHLPGGAAVCPKGDACRAMPEILPGQIWRAALILRRVHGAMNPGSFDHEGWMFSRGIRATAKVRGEPVLIADHPEKSFETRIARLRHAIRAGMRHAIGERRYAPVLIALAIGDQDSVQSEDWRVFSATGITHLVSISGSHVTMLAAIGAACVVMAIKRLGPRAGSIGERIPARVAGTVAAVLVAWAYCLLAGWGVPARRTFLMLAVTATGIGLRLPLSPTRIVCVAAALVVVADPWAPMATGFWLSFGAVAVLLAAGAGAANAVGQQSSGARLWAMIVSASRLQWLITLAMVPVIAFLFQQASVVSPVANAIAIPVITFVVTPLALATGLLSVLPGVYRLAEVTGWASHIALEWMMIPVSWLARATWATFDTALTPWPLLCVAIAGVAWALQPPGVQVRWGGWLLALPALAWQPARPPAGQWRLTAIDVGQGSAILVTTHRSNVLFDTGPLVGRSDAGERIVVPALRALGIRKLDTLVVSHADLDHAGGARALLGAIPVRQAFASYDLRARITKADRSVGGFTRLPEVFRPCVRGVGWESDGVVFKFLHPDSNIISGDGTQRPGNSRSCVLHVSGEHQSALLTGDIGVTQERDLLRAGMPPSSVVVVAHHGSRTSSAREFIAATGALHAIVQAGRYNRFGHPDPEVLQRWHASGASVWRTDRDGAVTAGPGPRALEVGGLRLTRPRYWHGR